MLIDNTPKETLFKDEERDVANILLALDKVFKSRDIEEARKLFSQVKQKEKDAPQVFEEVFLYCVGHILEVPCKVCGNVIPARFSEYLMDWMIGSCVECANREAVSATEKDDFERSYSDFIRTNRAGILASIGVPTRFLDASLDGLKNSSIVEQITQAMDSSVSHVYIYGDIGKGKTYAATAMLYSLILFHSENLIRQNHMPSPTKINFSDIGYFINVAEFLSTIQSLPFRFGFGSYQSSFGGDESNAKKTANDFMTKLQTVPYLILDDIGVTKLNDITNNYLYSLINHRDAYMLKTIYTSNSALKFLQDLSNLDSRIISRMSREGSVMIRMS